MNSISSKLICVLLFTGVFNSAAFAGDVLKPLDGLSGVYEGEVVDFHHLGYSLNIGAKCYLEIADSNDKEDIDYIVSVRDLVSNNSVTEESSDTTQYSSKERIALTGSISKKSLEQGQEEYLEGEDTFTCGDSKYLCATELPISARRDSIGLTFEKFGSEYELSGLMTMKGLMIDLWTFGYVKCQNMIKVGSTIQD